ncbi:MAG: PIG-L family deacetylase [Thermomicrobiales bacterium]|nr:PIG-L family deacetylase [Thermomicrobiales bacterium]
MAEPRYPDPTITVPERVLMIQAHPDDCEFSSGGTIARWTAAGAEVIYCSITSGDKGTKDPDITAEELIAVREQEQLEAASVLGVKDVIFLRYLDATLVSDLKLRLDLTRVIRQVRPTALMCFDPTTRFHGDGYINHPDHIAAGDASLAAVFPSCRDRRTFPELLDEGLEPVEVPHIYMFGTDKADCWIDTSDYIETKIAALRKHASQVGGADADLSFVYQWNRENTTRHPNKPEGFGEYSEAYKYMHLG